MSLSDTAIRNAKARDKQYKMSDDLGLYLLIKPNGSKLWRLDFQLNGKRKTFAIGDYPSTGLADARKQRDAAKIGIKQGVDPTAKRKLERDNATVTAANTFGILADEHLKRQSSIAGKLSEGTIEKKKWLLEKLAAPLRPLPIASVKPKDVLEVLQAIELSGRLETVKKLRSEIGAVFRYAIATNRAELDPTIPLKGALKPPVSKSFPAIVDEKKFGALAACIDEYDGWPTIRTAMQFIALVACRPIEVRKAEWCEIDFDKAVWKVPASRIKTRREHDVPLSRQAVAVLLEIRRLTGKSRYVFPSIRSHATPISENSINSALRRMGYTHNEHVSHGFRSSFSSILNGRRYDPEIIEHALAHKDSSIRGIYNRAKHWDDRVKLMQAWADLVDELKKPKRSDFDDLF